MHKKEGRYLICIIRANGSFYRYEQTDDIDKAVDIFTDWDELPKEESSLIRKAFTKHGLETIGIVNNSAKRPHLFLIDLTFTDEMVTAERTLASQSHLIKFKRVKRLYNIMTLDI